MSETPTTAPPDCSASHIISGRGEHGLDWQRICPQCRRWWALRHVERRREIADHVEARIDLYRCKFCQVEVEFVVPKWKDRWV